MSYEATINYLYDLQKYGIKFGLENIRRLMAALENPHTSFLSVHVAGTNGKGSTSSIISSMLQVAGFRVGLFTSPHLISFTERIRVNGDEITEHEVVSLAEEIKDIADHLHDFSPTFFEVVTAMALLFFKRRMIDIAVIEVGMGGRLDATNIIIPLVSVITNISYDHKEFLGDTLSEIAHEKAGIIKESVPVVTSHQEPEVLRVLEEESRKKNTALIYYERDFSALLKRDDFSGIYFDYTSGSLTIQELFLPLIGEHQVQNASVAIKSFEMISKHGLKPVAAHFSSADIYFCIREGLKNVRWPGRLEFINEDPPIVIDGAHNPAAANALGKALKIHFLGKYKKIIIILGIMGDKDIKGIMEPLLPLASEVIFTSPAYSRAASPENLEEVAKSLGILHGRKASTVKDAIELAITMGAGISCHESKISGQHDNYFPAVSCPLPLIVITGSFYTIGEAKEVLGQKGVLTRLRE